ncbi:MAG: hypothetical protein ISP01_01380, partial [Methanobrevibacter arboriphilus]|nr:hypothetical protein [Methanobrevibacter arboriphilus]
MVILFKIVFIGCYIVFCCFLGEGGFYPSTIMSFPVDGSLYTFPISTYPCPELSVVLGVSFSSS